MSITPHYMRHTAKGSVCSPSVLAVSGVYLRWLLHFVFLHVVQTQRDNFENDLHHYFFPILLLLFSFHFRL